MKRKVYYRGTSNPHEPNLIASGEIRNSHNQVSGQCENGFSVADKLKDVYKFFTIICKVSGEPLEERGSDGETLLDIRTVRLIL